MSTDNHDQTKPCVSKPPARIELNADESAFDGRRIKKERTDVSLENGDGSINAGINDTNKQLQSSQRPAAGRFSNGFHDDDLLQDIIAAKFTALANHGTTTKYDKIRLMIEDSIRLIQLFSLSLSLSLTHSLTLSLSLSLSFSFFLSLPCLLTRSRSFPFFSLIFSSPASRLFFLFILNVSCFFSFYINEFVEFLVKFAICSII